MTTAQDLIDRSVSYSEVARADWTVELAEALSLESDDSAETEGEVEYWGTREDGEEWRVHLRRTPEER